ncbi:MAG: hypothetical protein ACREBC_33350, partial [Pyrinomonadaceae bacterium]
VTPSRGWDPYAHGEGSFRCGKPRVMEQLTPRTCEATCDRLAVIARGDRDFTLIGRDLTAERHRIEGPRKPRRVV